MRTATVVAFLGILLITVSGATAQQNDAVQVVVESVNAADFPTVQIEVSVRDAERRPILGLEADDFVAREDGVLTEITALEDSDLGIAVVLVVDSSDSMFAMSAAREAAQAFVEALGPNDSVALIDFDTNVVTLRPLTNNHQDVIESIANDLEQGGRTVLYDGALRGVQEASEARQSRRMVVLLADGNDSGESISERSDAMDLANRDGIPVHTIGLGASADRAYLENIAALTGGEYLNAPDASTLRDVYVELAERLRHAYLLTIESGVPGDGDAHDLNIEVMVNAAGGSAEASFVASEIPPEITLPSPDEFSGRVSITPSVEVQGNRYEIAWELDGSPVNDAPSVPPFTVNIETSDLAPGEHTLSATVTDSAGLQASAELDFEIALLPPEISISGLRDGIQLDDALVSVEVDIASQTPINEVTFQLDDEAPDILSEAPFEYEIDPLQLQAGEHTLTVVAHNESDTPAEQIITFTATLSPPMVSLSDMPNDAASEPFTITAAVESQSQSRIDWALDDEAFRPAEANANRIEIDPVELEPGTHNLEVLVTDENDLTASVSASFEIAALPPEVVIDGIFADTTLVDQPLMVQLDITSQTAIDEVSVQIDDDEPVILAGPPYAYEIDPLALTTISETEHTVALRVVNEAGEIFEDNIPFSTTITPPQLTLTGLPVAAAEETFTLAIAIEAASPVAIEWLVDGEQVRARRVETDDSLEVDPYTFEPGTYGFSVSAIDDYDLRASLQGESFEIAALPPIIAVLGLQETDNLLGITDASLDITSQTDIREVNYAMDGADIETVSTAPYTYRIDPVAIGADDHTLEITVIAANGSTAARQVAFTVDESAIPSSGLNPLIIAVVIVAVLVAVWLGYRVGFAGKRTPIPGGGKVALVYEDILSGKETRYKIRAERTTIGRSPSNDVTLLDPKQRISREHAAIEVRGQKWVVEDLKSRLGVAVNDEKIDGSQVIFHDDILSIGDVKIRIVAPGFSRNDQDRLETMVDGLPSDLAEATPPTPKRKRTTSIKAAAPSEADTDQIVAITDDAPPDPKRRITMLKEDSTDEDVIRMAPSDTPIVPRTTSIKPAREETGLVQEADLPADMKLSEESDSTALNSPTPTINRPSRQDLIDAEERRATTRPSSPVIDSDEDAADDDKPSD